MHTVIGDLCGHHRSDDHGEGSRPKLLPDTVSAKAADVFRCPEEVKLVRVLGSSAHSISENGITVTAKDPNGLLEENVDYTLGWKMNDPNDPTSKKIRVLTIKEKCQPVVISGEGREIMVRVVDDDGVTIRNLDIENTDASYLPNVASAGEICCLALEYCGLTIEGNNWLGFRGGEQCDYSAMSLMDQYPLWGSGKLEALVGDYYYDLHSGEMSPINVNASALYSLTKEGIYWKAGQRDKPGNPSRDPVKPFRTDPSGGFGKGTGNKLVIDLKDRMAPCGTGVFTVGIGQQVNIRTEEYITGGQTPRKFERDPDWSDLPAGLSMDEQGNITGVPQRKAMGRSISL